MKNLILIALLISAPLFAAGNSQIISVSAPLTLVSGLIAVPAADSTHNGYLTSTSFNAFTAKLSGTTANLVSGTTGVTITGGTAAVLGAGTNIAIQTASSSQPGLLAASDFANFTAKANAANPILTGTIGTPLTASRVTTTDGSGNLAAATVTTTTLAFLDATSSIQTQLNSKQAALSGFTTDGVIYATSGTALASTSAGTAGNVLTSNGPGVAPTFQTAATPDCLSDSGNSGTSKTIDFTACNGWKSTLTGNVTYTLTNGSQGKSYLLYVLAGTGGFTITVNNTTWANQAAAPPGAPPSGKFVLMNFYCTDGTNYIGSFAGNY